MTRRRAERRLAALHAAAGDAGAGRCVRRLAAAVADPGRRGVRLDDRLAECLAHVEASPPGADRWLATEAAAWGIAVARRRRGPRRVGPCPALAMLGEAADAAADALAGGDIGAARCLVVAGTLLADDDAFRHHADRARAALEKDIAANTSADGALFPGQPASALARVERVAAWADTRAAVEACAGQAPWNRATDTRFQSACRTALAVLGPRARVPGRGGEGRSGPAIDALLAVVGRQGRRALATVRRVRQGTKVRATSSGDRLLPREVTRAEGCQAVIRSGWEADEVRVFVDWQGDHCQVDLAVGCRRLFSGAWPVEIAVDGASAAADGPWRFSSCAPCRHGTFFEIARSLVGGGEIQRQIVVLAADRVVLLADAVVVPAARGAVTIESRLSLAAPLTASGSDDTRERLLGDRRTRAALLPLALPEWTASPAPGELAIVDGPASGERVVRLRHAGEGRVLAPLWIDADRRRAAGPVTWRQLTVADTRRILGRHEAVGYRVQAGTGQWIVYRALDEPRNRTLLGCNVSCEVLVGRIKPRGRVGRSIEIE